MKNKIICLAIGIILSFFIMELLLRVAGFGYSLAYRAPKKHKDSDYRILCIGESTTFGIGTSNPALYSYPRQLEKMLNDNSPDLKIQCFYDQSVGFNTTKNLIRLPAAIKKYQPDLVVFMVGINNWWNLDKSNILLFNKNGLIQQIALQSSVFLDRFRVYKLLKWLIYSHNLIKLEDHVEWPDESSSDNRGNTTLRMKMAGVLHESAKENYGLNIFHEIAYYDLQEMIKICKKNKIAVIICSYPIRHTMLRRGQKKLSLLFDCYFVDNSLIFRKLSNVKDYFSYDGIHPNEKGYRIIAENIYNCILENKLIK